jgi:hypothetical protein
MIDIFTPPDSQFALGHIVMCLSFALDFGTGFPVDFGTGASAHY